MQTTMTVYRQNIKLADLKIINVKIVNLPYFALHQLRQINDYFELWQ